MHIIMQKQRVKFLALFITGLGVAAPAWADDPPKHGAPLLGGKVAMTKAYHFEVVTARDGLKVYPRTHEDKPVDASKLTGTVVFYHPNSPKPWFERKLVATAAAPGQAVTSLGTTLNLDSVPATGAKVEIKVEGLPDAAEPSASFTVPITFNDPVDLTLRFAKATQADQAAINAQRVCKVSGQGLGSMGGPIKVTQAGRAVFLCCQSCVKAVQADPGKFFGAAAPAAEAIRKP